MGMMRVLMRHSEDDTWYLSYRSPVATDDEVWVPVLSDEAWAEIGGRWFRLDEKGLPTTQELDTRRAMKLLLLATPRTSPRQLRATWTIEC